MPSRLTAVVLIGRPNVGKSTLFNRLTRMRRAIVTAIPGTTRDVIAQEAEWRGRRFSLVDTGGMFGASEDPLHALVLERGQRAVADADVMVLVVDGRDGLVPGDREIARIARAANRPLLLAINKMDDKKARAGALDFYQLGIDPVFEISAEHGEGIGDLLDGILDALPPGPAGARPADAKNDEAAPVEGAAAPDRAPPPDEVGIVFVGRPNAGKASLLYRLLREERMIVSEVPGTTRDAVDTVLTWPKRHFRIVDTAGIRRPGRVAQ